MKTEGAPQGEAIAVWVLCALLLAAIGVTFARIDPALLYGSVSRDGAAGGLSRILVASNFPVSFVALATTLLALDGLPHRAWLIGAPTLVLCAVTGWPGVLNPDDLDARPLNAVPAVGVVLALALTAAAAARSGWSLSRPRGFDRARVSIAAVVLLLSAPWIAAEIGFYLPGSIFITRRPVTESGGLTEPAVHLGHHHGLDGAVLIVSALLLSRPRLRPGGRARATKVYVSLLFAYGTVLFVEDLWHEQVVKRGWATWQVPSALAPHLSPIWLVVLGVAAGAVTLLAHES